MLIFPSYQDSITLCKSSCLVSGVAIYEYTICPIMTWSKLVDLLFGAWHKNPVFRPDRIENQHYLRSRGLASGITSLNILMLAQSPFFCHVAGVWHSEKSVCGEKWNQEMKHCWSLKAQSSLILRPCHSTYLLLFTRKNWGTTFCFHNREPDIQELQNRPISLLLENKTVLSDLFSRRHPICRRPQ